MYARECWRVRLPITITHPLSIQQQVDLEGHAVIYCDFLVPVEDLKDPAEHGAIVDARGTEAAFTWGWSQHTQHTHQTGEEPPE